MTAVDPALLDAVEQAHAAATPGPWEPWTCSYGPVGASSPDGDIVLDYSTWIDNPEDAEQARALTAAIVAAVNAAPALLAVVRAVYALADELDREAEETLTKYTPAQIALAAPILQDARAAARVQQHIAHRIRAVVETHLGTPDA